MNAYICDGCKDVIKFQDNKDEFMFLALYKGSLNDMIRFRDDCIEELNEWLGFKKDKEEK